MLVAARLIGLFRGLVFLRHWQRTISDFILRNSTGIWSSLKFNVIRHLIEICSSKDDPFHYLLLIRPMIEFFYPLLKIKQHAYTLSLHFSTRQQKQSICALRSHTANMKKEREKKNLKIIRMMQWRYVVFWVHSIFEKRCVYTSFFLFVYLDFVFFVSFRIVDAVWWLKRNQQYNA